MKTKDTGIVDECWGAEQCLDSLETIGDMFHAWKAAPNVTVDYPSVALARLGASILECCFKLREELKDKGGAQ